MKFYTHLRKYISKISLNFELNPSCESPADLKIQHEIGVLLGFLERVQTEFLLNRDQNLQHLGLCNGPKSATHHQSIHKSNSLKRIKVSGTIIRGTLITPNSQLVTPISIKLQRPDGYD
jgi:hypothetical protein